MVAKKTTKRTKNEVIEKTEPLKAGLSSSDGNNGAKDGGTKKKLPELDASTFQNAFRAGQGGFSAIRAMVERGEQPEDLFLRANFPSKRKDGHRLLIAYVHHVAKCRSFHDETAEEEAMNFMAGLPAVDNERMNQVERAIIGEKPRFNDGNNSSWGKRVQRAAWGNKDAEKE